MLNKKKLFIMSILFMVVVLFTGCQSKIHTSNDYNSWRDKEKVVIKTYSRTYSTYKPLEEELGYTIEDEISERKITIFRRWQ